MGVKKNAPCFIHSSLRLGMGKDNVSDSGLELLAIANSIDSIRRRVRKMLVVLKKILVLLFCFYHSYMKRFQQTFFAS